MRQRLLVVGSLAAAAVTFAACGGDDVAPQQTVAYFGLGQSASGASCSTIKTYQIPEGARMTVSTNGVGDRVKDGGDNIVECDVRPVRGSTTDYNVSLKFQGGTVGVGNFIATGAVPAPPNDQSTSSGNMKVVFTTGQFALQQDSCTVQIKKLLPGAIWVSNLHCDNLRDPSSPSIACDGLGGVIFENCGH